MKPTQAEMARTGKKLAEILMVKADRREAGYWTLLGRQAPEDLYLLVSRIIKAERQTWGTNPRDF